MGKAEERGAREALIGMYYMRKRKREREWEREILSKVILGTLTNYPLGTTGNIQFEINL